MSTIRTLPSYTRMVETVKHFLKSTQPSPETPVMGREVVIAITNGKLDFSPWELEAAFL